MNDVVKLMSRDEIREGYKHQDQTIVNGVLSGSIKVKPENYEAQPQVAAQQTTEQPVQSLQQPVEKPAEQKPNMQSQGAAPEVPKKEEPPQVNLYKEELERERRYAETIRKQKQEELELSLAVQNKYKREAEETKKAHEELEKRFAELEKIRTTQPQNPQSPQENTEHDDEYASEYSKRTRQEVQELKELIKNQNDPRLDEFVGRLNQIEAENKRIKELEKQEHMRRKQEEARSKLVGELESFAGKHNDLKPSRPLTELEKEVISFRNDIAYITRAKSEKEVDLAIRKYFDETGGEELRKRAYDAGVKAPDPEDFKKFQALDELWLLKNGQEVDPITGEIREIRDEFGNKICYRSVEEAFRVKNFYDELNRAHRESVKKFAEKVENIRDGAVTLDNKSTAAVEGKMSKETAMKTIREFGINPTRFLADPERMKVIQQAYSLAGMEMPRYRGKRI